MSDPVSLALGIVSLGSLFGTCIECLGYISATREFDRDRSVLLVKLDFERNKLLIWGNAVGILGDPSADLIQALSMEKDAHKESKKLLECIITLLTDAETLRQKYGMQSLGDDAKNSTLSTPVSRNNLEIFKPTLKRFLLRYPQETESRKRRTWSKIKWAISDKQNFQSLINDLKDLVDQLLLIRLNSEYPVNTSQLDACMRMDIELVGSVEQLNLVQEACEGSYGAWSEHAASVIAQSESGTTDRRNIEEVSRDLDLMTLQFESGRSPMSKDSSRSGK